MVIVTEDGIFLPEDDRADLQAINVTSPASSGAIAPTNKHLSGVAVVVGDEDAGRGHVRRPPINEA